MPLRRPPVVAWREAGSVITDRGAEPGVPISLQKYRDSRAARVLARIVEPLTDNPIQSGGDDGRRIADQFVLQEDDDTSVVVELGDGLLNGRDQSEFEDVWM
jgi:hypothetical protein